MSSLFLALLEATQGQMLQMVLLQNGKASLSLGPCRAVWSRDPNRSTGGVRHE